MPAKANGRPQAVSREKFLSAYSHSVAGASLFPSGHNHIHIGRGCIAQAANEAPHCQGILFFHVPPLLRRRSIFFQENSGLGSVLPVDFINETISAYQVAFPTAAPVEPEIAPPVEEETPLAEPPVDEQKTMPRDEAKPDAPSSDAVTRKKRLAELRKKHRKSQSPRRIR
jgi:hypothetical protein